MAKKKGSSKKRKNKNMSELSRIKRIVTFVIWIAFVITSLFYAARYFYNDISNLLFPVENYSEKLMNVKLKPGMKVEKINYTGHSVYFNSDYKIPNCVVYELLESELEGSVPRYKKFDEDPNVLASATTQDYIRSGYDRGHMAPAGDMKWSRNAMRESFYLSNICPQNKTLNTGAWHKLENRVREWAKRDSALIVVSGPILSGNMKTIGKNKVAVPSHYFKAILAPYAIPQRAIGFVFENDKCTQKLKKYSVSIDEIERITGYDLFYELDDSVEGIIESHCNYNEWTQR